MNDGYHAGMAAILIIIGLIVAIFLSVFWGVILMLIGLVLLFVPAVPYGVRRR